MNKKYSIVTTLAALFILASLFQNCSGSDFNVGEYTNSSTAASTPDSSPPPLTIPIIAPDIISKSADLAVNAGQPALFSISTSGSNPMTYAWYKDGNLIAEAKESSFLIPSTVTANTGTYAVSATNSAGTKSTTFQLTVIATPPPPPPATAAPVITSSPTPYLYILNTQPIQLQVVATGANLTYQWYFRPYGGANRPLAGATGSVYSKAYGRPNDTGTYTVVVTNAGGSVSAESEVEVDPETPGRIDGGDFR